MATAPSDFFQTERTASEIKSELLPRIFEIFVTSLLLGNTSKTEVPLLCMDLLAGLDDSEQAPAAVQWLQQVYRGNNTRLDLNQATQTVLYATDKAALAGVREKVVHVPFYKDIVHPPVILLEADDEASMCQALEEGQPAYAFLDPVQEGFSQQVLLHLMQTERAGLFLLFNPKDLGSALKKAKSDSMLAKIFGEKLEGIQAFNKHTRNSGRREAYLLDSFEETFQSKGVYTLLFKINLPDKKQVSYYIMIAAKSAPAYIKLKELLEGYSDYQEDGVPLFGANLQKQQTALFHEHYKYSIASLVQELSLLNADYTNKTVKHVYEKNSIGTHYTLDNYRLAFEKLMRLGRVKFINPKTGQPISKLTPTSLVRYTK
jgi:hypothetical protein